MSNTINLIIDGVKVNVPKDYTIMQAADSIGVRIPRLCYHSKLSSFGACRVCVVEVEGMKNYPASCSTQVSEGMKVKTHSAGVRNARKSIVELILSSHPHDCQICAKNNDCQLQALAKDLQIKELSFEGERESYPLDASSFSIIRDPEKCILCGKCVRVCSEIQGVNALSFSNRGFKTKVIPAYNIGIGESVCVNCGQCVNICPTGALMEKDAIDEVWRNIHNPDKTVVVQVAPAVRVAIGEGFGSAPGQDKTYQTVTALKILGFDVVFDTQFGADLTIMEEGSEFINRLKNNGKLPMITSCSPGWIKFCEAFYPEFLENISTCKSPQQMTGVLIKTYYAKKYGISPEKIYSVSVMPCTAKKFEAIRPEMNASGCRDVDAVLTTRELIRMIKQAGIVFNDLGKTDFDSLMGSSSGAAPIFGASGGVMEAALRTAYEIITGKEIKDIEFRPARGLEGIKESVVPINGTDIRIAIAHGLANANKLLEEVKSGKKKYHFIEIMACPGGCLGGGGQPYPQKYAESLDKAVYKKRAQGLYRIDAEKTIRKSHLNPDIKKIYEDFLGQPLGKASHKLLHTCYCRREPEGIPAKFETAVNLFI